MRKVLVHLNVDVPDDDPRDDDQIAEFVDGALHVGMEGADEAGELKALVVMAETYA